MPEVLSALGFLAPDALSAPSALSALGVFVLLRVTFAPFQKHQLKERLAAQLLLTNLFTLALSCAFLGLLAPAAFSALVLSTLVLSALGSSRPRFLAPEVLSALGFPCLRLSLPSAFLAFGFYRLRSLAPEASSARGS